MWDLIVSVPDHCLSFYFSNRQSIKRLIYIYPNKIEINKLSRI